MYCNEWTALRCIATSGPFHDEQAVSQYGMMGEPFLQCIVISGPYHNEQDCITMHYDVQAVYNELTTLRCGTMCEPFCDVLR